MDQPARDVENEKAARPEDQQDDGDGPEHRCNSTVHGDVSGERWCEAGGSTERLCASGSLRRFRERPIMTLRRRWERPLTGESRGSLHFAYAQLFAAAPEPADRKLPVRVAGLRDMLSPDPLREL